MDDRLMAELDLPALRTMAETAMSETATARAQSEKARDFYDGHQLTAQQEAELARRKQPTNTSNRIQRKVDAMVGLEQRSRVDPRAYARTPQDEPAADMVTKVLMYVDDSTRFDAKKSAVFENAIVEGYGGVEIIVEQKRGQAEITVNRLRWEELFFDPFSREKDFSDAGFMGSMRWMSLDTALAMYEPVYSAQMQDGGDDLPTLLQATMATTAGETFDDRPTNVNGLQWADPRQKRVRVAQMYYKRSGVWYLAIFTGGGIIFNAPSPYLDDDGKPTCAMILMTAYIDRENRRYGVVRSLIDIQTGINHRRSKLLHMLNTRQTAGAKGAVNAESVKRELGKPDGHVEWDANSVADLPSGMKPFEIISQQDQIAGQFALLQEDKSEIDMLGPNASLLGQLTGDQSGRAIMAQQQAGMAELAPLYDSLRDWTLRCYRAMWMRVRQFWTEPRYVRITDEMQAAQFMQVNIPQGFDPLTGQPIMVNAPAEMDVDIVIEEAPDLIVLQQEEFEQLTQMAQAGIPIPPEVMIEASALRNKKKILETMQAAQQAQAQQGQTMAQMEGAKAEAEIGDKRASAEKKQAETAAIMAELPQTQVESAAAVRTAGMIGL